MQSESSEQVQSVADTRGKHRILAELKRLEQETRFLECELFGIHEQFMPLPSSNALEDVGLSLPVHPSYKEGFSKRFHLLLYDDQADNCPLGLLKDDMRKREESEQLEKMEKASTFCKEMLNNVETRPDPLLPITNGPINPFWDRWFEGPREKSGCRCWIL